MTIFRLFQGENFPRGKLCAKLSTAICLGVFMFIGVNYKFIPCQKHPKQ